MRSAFELTDSQMIEKVNFYLQRTGITKRAFMEKVVTFFFEDKKNELMLYTKEELIRKILEMRRE